MSSKKSTGNILSHNTSSSLELKTLLEEQQRTNKLLEALLCSMDVMVQHLELLTDETIEVD
jgi:hypothetical protein